jgi:hypothetical protein
MEILNIYFAPKKYFESLKQKSFWLIPLIILIVTSLILTVTTLTSISVEQRLEQLRTRNLTPEQIEQAERVLKGPIPLISGIIGTIIFIPLLLLIISLILNFIVNFLDAQGNFITTFSVAIGAALVRIPSIIIRTIIILIRKNPQVETSLVLFVPFLNKTSFVYRFLQKFDFFTIWELILIALGLKIVYDLKERKIYYWVFGIWLIYIILTSLKTRY